MSAPAPEKFWWVWRLNGGMPTVHHTSRAQADHEAERLARSNPGDSFYVLEAVSITRKRDVEVVALRDSEEGIPF